MARPGQHVARIKFSGDATDAVGAAKDLAKQNDRLGRKVDSLQQKLDKKSRALDKASKAGKTFGEGLASVGKTAGVLAAAVGGALVVVDKWAESTIRTSNILGRAKINVDQAAAAVDNMTTKVELQRLANKLNTAGLDVSARQFAKLSGAVANAADASGKELVPALETATDALIKGNSRALASIGIKTDQSRLEFEFAKSLGKSTTELTIREKQQLTMNLLLKEAELVQERHTEKVDNAAFAFVRLKNELTNAADQMMVDIANSETLIRLMGELGDITNAGVAAAYQDFNAELETYNANLDEANLTTADQVSEAMALTSNMRGLSEQVDTLQNLYEAGVITRENFLESMQNAQTEARTLTEDLRILSEGQFGLRDATLEAAEALGQATVAGEIYGGSMVATFKVQQKVLQEARRADFIRPKGEKPKKKKRGTKKKKTEAELFDELTRTKAVQAGAEEAQADFERDILGVDAEADFDRFVQMSEQANSLKEAQLQADIDRATRRKELAQAGLTTLDPDVAADAEIKAKQRLLDFQAQTVTTEQDLIAIQMEQEQLAHEQRLMMWQREQEMQEQRIAMHQRVSKEVGDAIGASVVAAIQAGKNFKKAFFSSLAGFAFTKATELTITGISDIVQATSLAASPFTAALAPPKFASGGLALAKAGVVAALGGAALAAGRGGFSGHGGGGATAGGPSFGGQASPGSPSGGGDRGTAPTVPTSGEAPLPQQSGQQGNVVHVQFIHNGNVNGSMDEAGIRSFTKGFEKAARSDGNLAKTINRALSS